MFEKEAEEYQTEKRKAFNEYEQLCWGDVYKDWKKGAEFGYRKGNEWHYVKDGNPNNENDILCQISKDEVVDCTSRTKGERIEMNEREIEQRQKALSRACGICPICKKPMQAGQYAHKIGNREIYRKKYGNWIIDHTMNGEYVCSLSCNNSVDVGSSYGNHLEVIADILIYEYQKMWGAEGLAKLSDKLLEKYKLYGVENGTEKN